MLFSDLCLLFGMFFVSYQATCCQNMLTKILLSLSRFSSLGMLNMLSRDGLCVWFLISCKSLKVALWRVVTYYSHTTFQKMLRQGMFPIAQYSMVPRVWWLGTAASSQYSGDPALLAACQCLRKHQLGPRDMLVPTHRETFCTFLPLLDSSQLLTVMTLPHTRTKLVGFSLMWIVCSLRISCFLISFWQFILFSEWYVFMKINRWNVETKKRAVSMKTSWKFHKLWVI